MSNVSELPLGAAASGGSRLISEPAFELLFTEIIAYTGAFVTHSAASHATDALRVSKAVVDGDEENEGSDGDGTDSDGGGAIVEPNAASVGSGNAFLPVRLMCRRAVLAPPLNV